MGIVANDVGAFGVGASCSLLKLRHAPRYNRLDQSKAWGARIHTHRQHTLGQAWLQRGRPQQQSTIFMGGVRVED